VSVERADTPRQADERTMLVAWLDYHRATLERKCEGLDGEDLARRSVPPSTLSLIGLVRHMAEVERHWFQHVLLGEDAQPWYYSADNPDGDFDDVDPDTVADDLAAWRSVCARARHIEAECDSLDRESALTDIEKDEKFSLRWILVHMIEEYARHNGHADLLRECIDGQTGE
jgi:uncharacterized damage-inducible protein DinB